MTATDHFADNCFSNTVDPLQHPCAQHHNGRTYIAYQGPQEDAYVCTITEHSHGKDLCSPV